MEQNVDEQLEANFELLGVAFENIQFMVCSYFIGKVLDGCFGAQI
jgi:hypothetical protein